MKQVIYDTTSFISLRLPQQDTQTRLACFGSLCLIIFLLVYRYSYFAFSVFGGSSGYHYLFGAWYAGRFHHYTTNRWMEFF